MISLPKFDHTLMSLMRYVRLVNALQVRNEIREIILVHDNVIVVVVDVDIHCGMAIPILRASSTTTITSVAQLSSSLLWRVATNHCASSPVFFRLVKRDRFFLHRAIIVTVIFPFGTIVIVVVAVIFFVLRLPRPMRQWLRLCAVPWTTIH